MGRRAPLRQACWVGGVALLAVLALWASAGAGESSARSPGRASVQYRKPQRFLPPGFLEFRVVARTRDGMSFTAAAAGASAARQLGAFQASLATGGRRHSRLTSYFAPAGAIGAHFVRYELGGLGEVSLHFDAKSQRARRVAGCRGLYLERTGVFHGRLRFRAEDGTGSVRLQRVVGSLSRNRLYNCHGTSHVPRNPAMAEACTAQGVRVLLRRSAARTDARLTATQVINRRRLSVTRVALARSEVGGSPSRLSIEPGQPFAGTGILSPADGALSGDLSVGFIGRAKRMKLVAPPGSSGDCG